MKEKVGAIVATIVPLAFIAGMFSGFVPPAQVTSYLWGGCVTTASTFAIVLFLNYKRKIKREGKGQ